MALVWDFGPRPWSLAMLDGHPTEEPYTGGHIQGVYIGGIYGIYGVYNRGVYRGVYTGAIIGAYIRGYIDAYIHRYIISYY